MALEDLAELEQKLELVNERIAEVNRRAFLEAEPLIVERQKYIAQMRRACPHNTVVETTYLEGTDHSMGRMCVRCNLEEKDGWGSRYNLLRSPRTVIVANSEKAYDKHRI
jgi:hypothetical protein